MYEADPFLAQQEVKKRQVKAAEKREEVVASNSSTVDVRKASSNEFSQSPEVRMAASLRELVEDAIKEAGYSLFTQKICTQLQARNFLLIQGLVKMATHLQRFPETMFPSFLPNWGILVSIRPKFEMQKNFCLKALLYPPSYLVLYLLWKPVLNI